MFILDEFLGTNIGGRFDHPSIESIRIDRIVRAGTNVNLLVVNCHTNLCLFRGYEKEGEKGGERAEGKGLEDMGSYHPCSSSYGLLCSRAWSCQWWPRTPM